MVARKDLQRRAKITVAKTCDPDLVLSLCSSIADLFPPKEVWSTDPNLTFLVAKENGVPQAVAVLVENGVETGQPEIHIHHPVGWKYAIPAYFKFKKWIKKHKNWTVLWSFTDVGDDRTLLFAKHFGFEHAFTEGNRNYLAMKLTH